MTLLWSRLFVAAGRASADADAADEDVVVVHRVSWWAWGMIPAAVRLR